MDRKMLNYSGKRLFLAAFTILLIVTITFFIMHAVPSSPFLKQKALTPAVVEALKAKYGLDKPLFTQYLIYVGNVCRLDFGESIFYRGRDVSALVLGGFSVSMRIGLTAAALAIVSGIILGALAALNRGGWLDKTIMVVTTSAVSLPSFVIAILLLWTFGVIWQILPTRGDTTAGLILPVISLAVYPSSYVTRLIRSSMLDVLGQDYIRTARAKGVSPAKVLFKHAMKNALTPVVTYAGPMIAYIIVGSFVVEQIFSVPGLGRYFVNSIQNSDYPLIMGTTVFLSMIMIVMNFLSDIGYKLLDRRIDFS